MIDRLLGFCVLFILASALAVAVIGIIILVAVLVTA